ncbi:MAG: ferredoxin [Shinella sp.]|nr:ferredoxin [Shinella sp.]
MTGQGRQLETIRAVLEPHGLFLRGVVNFEEREQAPPLKDGRPAASLVLVGNIGGSIWPAFRTWQRNQQDDGGPHPLDAWSKAVVGVAAQTASATAWFPSDPPWQPFQQWAMRAEGLKASPLGILIHPQYGLWHGYRAALGFDEALPRSPKPDGAHPCAACVEKPCMTHCPVSVVSEAGFDVTGCRRHLRTDRGRGGCLKEGCLARNACPVGRQYRYSQDQLRFHMAALR